MAQPRTSTPTPYLNVKNCACSNINLFYFNVHSLLPKIDNLRAICTIYSPDIFCIVESWLNDTIVDSEVTIQGYSLCRLDRCRHGGGILIFVKSVFTYSLLFKGSVDFEYLVLSVNSVMLPALTSLLHCFIDLQALAMHLLTHCFLLFVIFSYCVPVTYI